MANSVKGRRAKLMAIARSFPEAMITEIDQHAKFSVGKRTFAYYVNYPHGGDPISLCCKAPPGEASRLVTADPERFFIPRYLGPRGWIGFRLDLNHLDWEEVNRLLFESYQLVAPKRLAELLCLCSRIIELTL